jgi:hypothetical protein
VSEAAAPVHGAAARQGRALRGCLREKGSRVEANGNSAPAWQLHGNKDVARTWRRRLHEPRMEQRWWAVDSADARWRALTKPPRHPKFAKYCRSIDWNTRSNFNFWIKFKIPEDCKL